MGMSNEEGTAEFTTSGQPGDELASMSKAGYNQSPQHSRAVKVPITTIDAFVEKQGLERIDYCKIDTEGFDALVVRGAERTLRARKISLLQFEYNDVWNRVDNRVHNLRSTTEFLESLGYDCYLLGRRNMVQLTRGLWDPSFEIMAWSNCFCIGRHMPQAMRSYITGAYNLDYPTLAPQEMCPS